MSYDNTNTLITGASRGLGLALARILAARGSRVVLVAREAAALQAAVVAIRGAGGVAHGIVADIADKHSIHKIAGQAAALVGPIDILIHNASTLGPLPMPLLLDTECEDFEAVLAVNLLAPFRLTRVLAGAMAMRGRGLVVTISSDAAIEPYPGWGAYGVSKAALDHLQRIWARELAAQGVRFVAIDPGEMNTKMHADAMPDADPNTLVAPDYVAARIAELLGQPESGARLVVGR